MSSPMANVCLSMITYSFPQISSKISTVKKQYEARIDSMRHSYLGDRLSIEIPTSPLAEDENISELIEESQEADIDDKEEGKLNLDL